MSDMLSRITCIIDMVSTRAVVAAETCDTSGVGGLLISGCGGGGVLRLAARGWPPFSVIVGQRSA